MSEFKIDEQGRECSVCKDYKAWDEFNKAGNKTDHDHRCKECLKAYRATAAYKKASRERAARNYRDPEKRTKQIEAQRRYYSKPEIREKVQSEEYRVRAAERAKGWRKKIAQYPDKLVHSREVCRKRQQKHMQDPKNKLSNRICCEIRHRLASRGISKNRRHWEYLVGYTVETLKQHLEAQFESGMSWENHGEWHIDHIVPVAAFEFKSVEDEGFKKCWGLGNLTPRWATTDIAREHGSLSIGNTNKGKKLILT